MVRKKKLQYRKKTEISNQKQNYFQKNAYGNESSSIDCKSDINIEKLNNFDDNNFEKVGSEECELAEKFNITDHRKVQ